MEENKNTWCVYKHTSPSGKVYIGVTHHSNPERRYGKNGIAYKACIVFYKAIVKYGWPNITHEILFDNLSEEEAAEWRKKHPDYMKNYMKKYNQTLKEKHE